MDKSIVITGVAGFLGHYAASHFTEQGWKVIGIDSLPLKNAPANLHDYYSLHLPAEEFDSILKRQNPDACIQCAGGASVGLAMSDPVADYHAGPLLTFEVLNSLRLRSPNCRFLFLSSAAVYGNPRSLPISESHCCEPLSSYGYHKWQCELLCREFSKVYGLQTASLRLFSAYGNGLKRQVIWDICRKALMKQEIILQGTGSESRDFIHALDIAAAMEIVVTSAPMQGEVYNLGSGREVTIRELSNMILNVLGIEGSPLYDETVPLGYPLNWQADISLLATLGFSPSVSLDQGVLSVANWCREQLRIL